MRIRSTLIATALLTVAGGAAAAAGPGFNFYQYTSEAFTETGSLTTVWMDFDENPRYLALITPNGADPETEQGLYIGKGTTSMPIAWHVTASTNPGGVTCMPSFVLDGQEAYAGPALTPAVGGAPPMVNLYPSGWHGHDMVLDGDVLTQAAAREHVGTAAITLDCGPLGAGTWSGALRIVGTPDPDREDGVSIDDGDDFTNTPNVKLYVGSANAWGQGIYTIVDKVKVSNDGGFAPSKTKVLPISGNGPVDWTLVQLGEERLPRTVYVRLHVVGSGWQRDTYTDDILLDTIKPTITNLSVTGGTAGLRAGLAPTAARTVTIKAKDNKSGVAGVQVTAGKKNPKAPIRPFATKVKVVGAGTVFARVRDGAGNWSAWRSA